MDKTAQRRSILNRLHEMANVPARSAENFFKPELKRVMNTLINADDVVRSTLLGQKVGNASPEDPVSAKDLLKEAKSFINRREYLSAVSSLGRFHKKMQDVAAIFDGLKLNVDSLHHRFLFEKLPTKHKEQLDSLEKRFAAERLPYFTKQAGFLDVINNIGTQRGRALAAWEKRYPQVVGKIREGAASQLEASTELLNITLLAMKELATFRAARKIDNYLTTSKTISDAFRKYDNGKNGFRKYYTEVIKPYLDTQRKIEAEEAAAATKNVSEETKPADMNQPTSEDPSTATTINQPPIPEAFQSPDTNPTPLPAPPKMPTGITPPDSTPTVPSLPAPTTKMTSDEVAEELWGKKKSSYDAFVGSLEIFAEEEPHVLAAHITNYARSIQNEEPSTAIKLFGIAQKLRG